MTWGASPRSTHHSNPRTLGWSNASADIPMVIALAAHDHFPNLSLSLLVIAPREVPMYGLLRQFAVGWYY
jgi:hypothetical protein